jgi:hypothetical protein
MERQRIHYNSIDPARLTGAKNGKGCGDAAALS